MVAALRDVTAACNAAGIRFLGAGYLAMTGYRRGMWPVGGGDIDLLLKSSDVEAAQAALVEVGFRREPTTERWLRKAIRDRILVDLILVAGGSIRPDDEMIARGHDAVVAGIPLRVISAEDYVVMQSLATKRAATGYWFDAIELLPEVKDWAYLLKRARENPARMLSLLSFAIADGRAVPADVLQALAPNVERMAAMCGTGPHIPAGLMTPAEARGEPSIPQTAGMWS